MRLRELRVRGYKRLRDLTIDLDHDRVLVVGPNEAGKSTVMEALMTGLYGLQPAKKGHGHGAGLKRVMPWGEDSAGLALRFDLDDGSQLEADWDLAHERTQVIDHTSGEDVTARYATGTHGWIDLGESALGLPAAVFAQLTQVGEGELALIKDDAAVRGALRRLTDSGVDVLVEEAIDRLEEGARQAAIPRANSATRGNQLSRDLTVARGELAAANQARESLAEEVDTLHAAEIELASRTARLEVIHAEEARRADLKARMDARLDRARGVLSEAELRVASFGAGMRDKLEGNEGWGEAELDAARRLLVAAPASAQRRRSSTIFGAFLIVLGIAMLAGGVVSHFLPVAGGALVVIAAGVYLVTRAGVVGAEPLKVGGAAFADRTELMAAMDYERARRDLRLQEQGLRQLEEEAARAEENPPGGGADPVLAGMSRAAFNQMATDEAHARAALELKVEGMRAALERGSRDLPEVAPLNERVAQTEAAIARLDAFGAACTLAAETLARAGEEMRRAYAPRLQQYLSRDLARVTGGRYVEALVSERFEVLLRAPETGSMVDLGRLSRGTQQQIYLLLRLGLLEVMGGSAETLPLFLDDALALSDDERRGELLRVLEGEKRQVIYFTAGEDQSGVIFGPAWHRVLMAAPPRAAAGAPTLSVVEGPPA